MAFCMIYTAYKLNKQGDNIQLWHNSFPNFEPVHCSISGSNCCFWTWIQETRKVVWYSHLFKNFPQFILIHADKSFSVVNEAEVDVFLEFSCFFYDPTNVGNLISGSSVFFKFSLCVWEFLVHILLKPSLKDLSITLLACEMSTVVQQFEHSLALTFFGIGRKTDLFQSCDHCWVFHICWHIACSTLTASSFRTWSSSAGVPSPPLALFIVMLLRPIWLHS